MSKILPPPLYEPILDQQGVPTMPWALFFNSLYNGDTGQDWTPNFVNLTENGPASFSGRYYKLSQNLVYFKAIVTPGTDTTSVAGTTYIDNFPLDITGDSACLAVSGNAGSNAGMCVSSSKRIYVPAWTTVTVPVTIVGTMEAK